jgi:hypothetical protein
VLAASRAHAIDLNQHIPREEMKEIQTGFPESGGEEMMFRTGMIAALLLAGSVIAPTQQAAAQDPLGGAILGGAAGAIIGGAVTGRGQGAAIGAVIGATTGAIIASEGRRNARGYYAWDNGCYLQRRDGRWVRAHPKYCY